MDGSTKGSRKNSSSLNGRAIKRGGGVKGRAIKEKRPFFKTFFSNVPKFQRQLSSRGGGGLGLNDPANKRRNFFCGFPKAAILKQRNGFK